MDKETLQAEITRLAPLYTRMHDAVQAMLRQRDLQLAHEIVDHEVTADLLSEQVRVTQGKFDRLLDNGAYYFVERGSLPERPRPGSCGQCGHWLEGETPETLGTCRLLSRPGGTVSTFLTNREDGTSLQCSRHFGCHLFAQSRPA